MQRAFELVQRVRSAFVRALCGVFVLVGVLLVATAFPPEGGESAAVVLVGAGVALFGAFGVANPHRVELGDGRRDQDDDRIGERGL